MHIITFTLAFLISLSSLANMNTVTYDQLRQQMVDQQITARGVKDASVINAMLKVERHLFVPVDQMKYAYEDHPLPIGYDQTISQPYIVAYMSEALMLTAQQKVLEIGTGSGYQAAILAEMVNEVYSIEIVEPLAIQANALLQSLGYDHVKVKHGDGYQGWSDYAPYDAIIVTAAPPELPKALIEQLTIGGRMIIPVGTNHQELLLIVRTEDGYQKQKLLPVRFVPMIKGDR